jgi:hypothetical protein
MSDERLAELIEYLAQAGDGFANYCVMKPELLEALKELQQYREKPLHCPCCDGQHL